MSGESGRDLRVLFQPDWDPGAGDPGRRGLMASDPRVRTLLRVLVSYPEVRYILPDRISLDPMTDPGVLDTLGRFLRRQTWLVKSVIAR